VFAAQIMKAGVACDSSRGYNRIKVGLSATRK
jgi:hypothetical protein